MRIARNTGQELITIASLDEESSTALFAHNYSGQDMELETTFLANIPFWVQELTGPRVSRQLIWGV